MGKGAIFCSVSLYLLQPTENILNKDFMHGL